MFKKLTNRFTLILVISISIVLIASFSVVYLTTKDGINRQKEEDFNILTGAILEGSINPFNVDQRPRKETYVIIFSEEIDFTYQTNDDLLEVDTLYLYENMDQSTIELNDQLWEHKTVIVHQKEAVIFINVTDLNEVVSSMVQTLLIIGVVALLIMSVISRIFVIKIIKPIKISYTKQKEFVSSASHELRTPLAIMNSNLDILLNYPDKTDKEKESWLKLLKDEVHNMTSLSNSLLFLTSTKSTNLEDVNISDVINNKLLMYDALFYEKKIKHDSTITSDLHINGINTQLNQLFTNLIDNAVKYSVDNLIEMSLYKKGHKVIFEISNKTDQETINNTKHLFDRFYKVDTSRSTIDEKSYGLGLPIAKFITENHNGKIEINTENELITFTVSLPISKKDSL